MTTFPDSEATYLEAIAAFEEEYPWITVELTPVGDEYWTVASARAATNDLPDVMNMSSGLVPDWMRDNLLYDISDFVERDLDPDDWFLDAAEVARGSDGGLYAFPRNLVTTVLFYNVDAFEEAGLDIPDWETGWAWEDFLTAAQALTEGDTVEYGYQFTGRYAHVDPWIWQNNGSLYDFETDTLTVDENAEDALNFLYSLVHDHGVSPAPADMEGLDRTAAFTEGIAGMFVDGIWDIDTMREGVQGSFEWDIAPIPRGPGTVEDNPYGWPNLKAVTADTDHPEEAWMLLHWLVGENRDIESLDVGNLPVYVAHAESDASIQPDLPPRNQARVREWMELLKDPLAISQPAWGEWRGYTGGSGMTALIDEALNGRMTMGEAIEQTETFGNQAVAEALS